MSLLDQFNRESGYNVRGGATAREDPYDQFDQMLETIRAPSATAHQESNMFSLERVDYRPKALIQMRVCNDLVLMALENGHLIRLSLAAPQDLEDIEFAKRGEMIHSIHMDPTGSHVFISMESRELWYLHQTWPKPRLLSRIKGLLIECVAWDMQNTDKMTTSEVLFGTQDGRIYECIIDKEGRERVFRPVYNLNEGSGTTSVRGLHYERFPSEPHKYFVMATTPTRIYQFIGGPTFEAVFTSVETHPTTELPGELPKSELRFFSKNLGMPRHFAWLSGPGIFHGNLVFGSQNPGDTITTDTHLLPYPGDSTLQSSQAQTIREKGAYGQQAPLLPASLGLTEFHFLLVYEDRFLAISILNNQVVYEELLGRGGPGSRLIGITQDLLQNTIWLYGEDVIYQVRPNQEDRYVWKLLLDKGLFEEALHHCKNPQQRDVVWSAQADSYFAKHVYGLAAEYYGKTTKSFEEVALKFIEINEREALKTFLMAKLRSLPAQDVTQKTAICTWVTEIYLNKLNQLANAGLGDQHEMLKEEFAQFLGENHEHLDKQTTINLIQSHGRGDEFLIFCGLLEDYERVIDYHIQHTAYERAIAVLSSQTLADPYYKFSPILMAQKPQLMVNAWISARAVLNPRKLFPALMRYKPSPGEPHQGIRYLEHCVIRLGNEDPAVHNYLLSLYAELQNNDEPLLNFLSAKNPHFDLKYALRLCTKHNKRIACVLIYSAMGLYEEAVDLALEVDLELAKFNADKPNDDELRKKLWLRIARQVVEKEKDIKKAMAFLRHCELLKIEDILPFFPDFVLIDDFKDEICSSLEEYNRHIDDLKAEMDDPTNSANLIRMDIKALRNKYGFVAGNQKCDLCGFPVLSRLFYLFPCQHAFHADCLRREVVEHLSKEQFAKVRELEQRLSRAEAEAGNKLTSSMPGPTSSASDASALDVSLSPVEQCKAELDDVIAAECMHCGDIMINSISLPFFDSHDEAQMRAWAL